MEPQIDYNAIGNRIRVARQSMGLTQESLAMQIDLSTSYMSNIENGRTKLSLGTIISIAQVLGTTVDSLLYDNTPVLIEQYDQDAKLLLTDCTPQERQFIIENIQNMKISLRTFFKTNKGR